MKKRYLFFILILIMLVSACSQEDELQPTEYLDTYIAHWEDMQFDQMYDMLTDETKDTYSPEQVIDRYEKIYEDLNITNIDVSYENLSEEELQTAQEEGTATFPIHVSVDSIAGEIAFDYDATFEQFKPDEDEEDEREKSWQLSWNPGFIFPELKNGGEIAIESTSPKRGEILDRNMMPLAINDDIYEIGIIPEKLGETANEQKEAIADILMLSVESIDEKLNEDWVQPDLFVPLKKVAQTDEETLEQLWEIDSILGKEVTGRVYPLGKIAAHLTGYVGTVTAEELEEQDPGTYSPDDVIGKRGLEQLYEGQLKGDKGIKVIVTNNDDDEVILAEKPVEDGETITLTIDVNVQKEIYQTYEDKAGTAAAIDPTSGETLALVNSPSFDPNDLLYGISQSKWDELENNPQTPLVNRFAATFAPGSVIKPISSAIGLTNGTIDPEEGFEIEGETWDNGEGWGDYQVRRVSTTDEPVDLANALFRSHNIFFAMQAVEMGTDALVEGLHDFGFGDSFPFEYPFVESTVSSSGDLSTEVEAANTIYGQGELEMSPLHLAIAYTPFLNDGDMLKPTLLTKEESEVWKEQLVSSEDAALIEETLRKVVTDGTAQIADEAPFPISGKTGTVELKLTQDEKDGKLNGWFVGYPTDDPDILVAMMIEDVEGSSIAVEKVTKILTDFQE